MNKRVVLIVIGIFLILFSVELFEVIVFKNMDTIFYALKVISIIVVGIITSVIGIFYPFKDKNK